MSGVDHHIWKIVQIFKQRWPRNYLDGSFIKFRQRGVFGDFMILKNRGGKTYKI